MKRDNKKQTRRTLDGDMYSKEKKLGDVIECDQAANFLAWSRKPLERGGILDEQLMTGRTPHMQRSGESTFQKRSGL